MLIVEKPLVKKNLEKLNSTYGFVISLTFVWAPSSEPDRIIWFVVTIQGPFRTRWEHVLSQSSETPAGCWTSRQRRFSLSSQLNFSCHFLPCF